MFWLVFIAVFIISAIVISAICNAFMRLMGADMYFFNVKIRIIICAVIAFFAAVLTLPG